MEGGDVNFTDVYASACFWYAYIASFSHNSPVCFKAGENMVSIESGQKEVGVCEHRLCLPCGLGIVKTAVSLQRTPECPFCKLVDI
jgi:hypothetical protein